MADPQNAGPGNGNAPAGPPAAAPPAGGSAGADLMTVPRDSVNDWDGDWHRMAADANVGKALGTYGTVVGQMQAAGVTPEQLASLLQPAAPPEGFPPAGSYPAPAPGLKGEEVRAIIQEQLGGMGEQLRKEFGTALGAQREQDRKDMQRQADFDRGNREEHEFMVKHLTTLGANPFDDKNELTPHGGMFMREFQQALNAVLTETEPEGLDDEARHRHFQIASPEAMEKAGERMTWLKDFKYEAALAAAAEQENEGPAASLGAGEGGKQPPGDFDAMNREQQDEAIMKGVEVPADEQAG